MSLPKDGGLAFPGDRYEDMQLDSSGIVVKAKATYPGMSLRDYFAAQALVMFTDPRMLVAMRDEARATGQSDMALLAKSLYELADCLLAERAK